MNVTDDAVL